MTTSTKPVRIPLHSDTRSVLELKAAEKFFMKFANDQGRQAYQMKRGSEQAEVLEGVLKIAESVTRCRRDLAQAGA